jgi:5-methylcytosine-specific restriction endonuclease McrA
VTIPVVNIAFSLRPPSDSFARVEGPSFIVEVDEAYLRREKSRARELRQSQWWKRRRSTGICHYCGGKFPPSALTMDHVVPLIRGGRSSRGNVVPACRECNAAKKYQLAWEL